MAIAKQFAAWEEGKDRPVVAGVSMDEVLTLNGNKTAITRGDALARSIVRTPERTSCGRGRWMVFLSVRQRRPSLIPIARTAQITIALARNPPKSKNPIPAITTSGHHTAQLDNAAMKTSNSGGFGVLLRAMKRFWSKRDLNSVKRFVE